MNIGRAQATFVNKTGGGLYVDNISVPSGFVLSSVISPTGTTLQGDSKYKGTWVNHDETVTINFKMSYNGFNVRKTGNVTISYTCEDDSTSSHSIPVEGAMTIAGSFPSKLMTSIAFHDQRPRGHLLIKDENNLVNGYPTYKDKSGKVVMYVNIRNGVFHWHYSYDGVDRVYYTPPLKSSTSNSGVSEHEGLISFPLDCSFYGNTHLNYGEDTGKNYSNPKASGTYTNSSDLKVYSYMQWDHVNTTQRDKVRFLFIQTVDSVGWKKDTSTALNEGLTPNIVHAQLCTDKSPSNHIVNLRTDNPGNKYKLREWFIHRPDGKAARIITQYGNFDIDTDKIGFGNYGTGRIEGYCRYRMLHVRDECTIVSDSSNPSSTYGRISKWSKVVDLPNYKFVIKKNGTDTGSANGWAAGQLVKNNSLVYEDCGWDTKYTVSRSVGGQVTKIWYDEGATPSSRSNWDKTNNGKGTRLYTFDAPQGNGIKAHGKSSNHTPLIFHKTGIPGDRWRIKAYVMCVASWDNESGSVTVNGVQQLTFQSHGYHMHNVKSHNGASFTFKAGAYRNTPTRYPSSTDWTASNGPRSVLLVSEWFTGSECTAQFNFNTNQDAEDESGFVSHMQIETDSTDPGGEQPLVDINRHVVMGVNENKSGVLKAGTYACNLYRGHNTTASTATAFKIVSSSKTASASSYISNNSANWGAVGVDKGTYFTGWQCCESGKGLGSYCNLYSPEDEIKDVNGWGINELRKTEARSGTEVFVIRYVCRATNSSAFGWYTTSFGSNGLNGGATRCWGCTVNSTGGWRGRPVSYPYQTDYGREKKHLSISYTNPTDKSLQVKVPFRCHSFSDDYLSWALYVYDHTNKKTVKSPNGCGKPPGQNGNPPGHWGDGDPATRSYHYFNGTINWHATIPPKTKYEFYVGACLGHGWCQHEGGAAYWIGLEPKKFV